MRMTILLFAHNNSIGAAISTAASLVCLSPDSIVPIFLDVVATAADEEAITFPGLEDAFAVVFVTLPFAVVATAPAGMVRSTKDK